MISAYNTEVYERCCGDKSFIIENVIPSYRTWEEHEKAKKEIEERLFDVFYKYASDKS